MKKSFGSPARTARSATALSSALLLSSVVALGCGSPAESTGEDCSGATFEALTSTFQSFRTWEAFPLNSAPIPSSPHTSGPRTIYLNKRPEHGSARFPLKTVIVKEFTMGPFDQRQVFAMVKRGGCYNQDGATDWEWFELINSADGTTNSILWRGVAAPPGETYSGVPNSCNNCHEGARSNDFVQAPIMELTNF